MLRSIVVVFSLGLIGCTGLQTTTARPADYVVRTAQAAERDASLFASDSAVLKDEDIARILEYEYSPPDLSRIALLPFGWSNWSGWSEEMAASVSGVDADILQRLHASPHIYDASFLPSILIPEQRTIPYLREAAARYQADLLLAFRSSCRSFQRNALFRSESTRAWCAVEAVLLDVRTGLVPFVAAASENFDAVEESSDVNFQETILRGQLNALASALGAVSRAVAEFIDQPGSGV